MVVQTLGRKGLHQWWIYGLVITLMIVTLSGCGSSDNDRASDSKQDIAMSTQSESAIAVQDQYGNAESPAATDQDTAAPQQPSPVGSNSSVGTTAADLSAYDRKLIYNANVVLEVEEYGEAQTQLFNMVTLAGGYMLNFNDVKSMYESGGMFVIKIPSSGFQSFVTNLEQLKKDNTSIERSIQGKDVTEEYVDIASRLKAKQVVEARLLSFMEKATDTKNLLQFSNELARIQEEIEAIKGRMRYIDQNVAFSTVEIRMYEKLEGSEKQSEHNNNVLSRAGDAMKSSGKVMLAMFEGLFIVLAGAIPILIVIGLLIAIILLIYRKTRYTKEPNSTESYVTQINSEQVNEPQTNEEQEK